LLYLRPELFFEELFFAEDFFDDARFEDFFAADRLEPVLRLLLFLLEEDFFVEDLRPDDFFLLAFLVAILGATSREV